MEVLVDENENENDVVVDVKNLKDKEEDSKHGKLVKLEKGNQMLIASFLDALKGKKIAINIKRCLNFEAI